VRGLDLLGWLLARETRGRTPLSDAGRGSGPGDVGPALIKAIEVSTMADAWRRALSVDDSPKWLEAIGMANAWLTGTMTPKS